MRVSPKKSLPVANQGDGGGGDADRLSSWVRDDKGGELHSFAIPRLHLNYSESRNFPSLA